MTVVGISRSKQYSPGRESADAAIFEKVSMLLENQGVDVVRIPEEFVNSETFPTEIHIDAVFQMARSEDVQNELSRLDIPIINSVSAVRNCGRTEQIKLLGNRPFLPASVCLETTNGVPAEWNIFPCWVKRGDSHSVGKDDVCLAQNSEEASMIVAQMQERGIKNCILQKHVSGKLLKFYGVRGYGIVGSYYPTGADKFGNLQQCNDKIPDADIERVSTIAEESAEMLETDVYGGDLIVTEEGTLYLVDFNDWPSFGCCQDKAAKVIAELILNRI